jgi:hypothetical protein
MFEIILCSQKNSSMHITVAVFNTVHFATRS